MQPNIQSARQTAANRYPEVLIDSMGREHPSTVRRAILNGAWDLGAVVQAALRSTRESEVTHD